MYIYKLLRGLMAHPSSSLLYPITKKWTFTASTLDSRIPCLNLEQLFLWQLYDVWN